MILWNWIKMHWVTILTYLIVALLVWIVVGMPFFTL